jgi:(1->4)-alpha-D-glucan 1-alpha-D-glucosylmutase
MRATYRLQMRNGFDFAAATDAVPYLARLGISHVYLSPVFTATPGSTHGYDTVDPNEIDPTLGGRDGFEALVHAAREHDLGILLDIVPNHLAAHEDNPWWWEMLRDGPTSAAARVFDVDWDANAGRIVLPVLGDDPDQEIATEALTLDRAGAEAVIRYHDRVFPVAPGTADGDLTEVLARQAFELAQWREGLSRLNYRRFFDVTDLAGVRVEDPDVFELTHALVLDLVARGLVDALRVDHVDGLADPAAYLERLAVRATVPIYVEKILNEGEELPGGWPIAGTTGYEVLSDLLLLHVDAAGLREMDHEYEKLDGGRAFDEVERGAKAEMLRTLFPPELRRVARHLGDALDVGSGEVEDLVARITVDLDVYRTYLAAGDIGAADAERLRRIIDAARADLGPEDAALAERTLLVLTDPQDEVARRFATTWQQLTGPVMAKGHEDTALYRHTRLLATNEVGVDPDSALTDDAVARFHEHARDRQTSHPSAMVTTATHDTKRGEDTRLRVALLADAPGQWRRGFDAWLALVAPVLDATAPTPPTRRELRLIAQTILGSWPVDGAEWDAYPDRVVEYVRKAAREAKETTSWLDPDPRHEDALESLVRSTLDERGATFARAFGDLLARLGPAAAAASLGLVVLKVAGPGVPDTYQGTEGWDLSLVDPDNRRPVDFARAARQLEQLEIGTRTASELLADWPDGGIKHWVTRRALATRADDPDLFLDGSYEPLEVRGPRADHVVAFARRLGERSAIAVATHGCLALDLTTGTDAATDPLELWAGTSIEAPDATNAWIDQLAGATINPGDKLAVAEILATLPTALLLPRTA